jgi:tetratricopeptide (TPR) repeat protein
MLMTYESVQLFIERAQAVQEGFTLTDENATAVARVCSQLEGIPLAIELAAAQGNAMTVEHIDALLNNRSHALTERSGTIPSRQQTLRATMDWSYALLQESERRLLRRLSVFVGGWRLEAAEAVCAGEGIRASQVLNLLMTLIDKSLVVFRGQQDDTDGRYHLLEMVRQYAGETLQASGEEEEVRRRHQQWCLTFAEQAEPALRTSEQEVWLTRLDREYGNLRDALDRGQMAAQASEAGLRIAAALWRFWGVRGRYSEGREYLERVLGNQEAQARTAARAKALSGAGNLAHFQSDYTTARALYHESLGIRKELQDKLGTAELLSKLGQVEVDWGDYAAAKRLYNESLSLRRELKDQRGIADSVNILGTVADIQGDYASARALYEESLSIHRKLGEPLSIATLLYNLGTVAYNQGDFVSAWSLSEESLNIRRELKDQRGIASSLQSLGTVASRRGNHVLAQSLYSESLGIHRELGDRRGIALLLLSLGNMAIHQGEYARSREYYEESLSIHRELGHRLRIALTLGNLGELAHAQGDFASAQSLYDESLRLWKELGAKDGIACVLAGLGNLAHDRGDYRVAQALHRESLEIFSESRDLWGVAESLNLLAAVMLAQSEPRRATCLWSAAQRLRESIDVPLCPADQQKYDRRVAQARSTLGEAAFTAAWEEGRALTWEQATQYALEVRHS